MQAPKSIVPSIPCCREEEPKSLGQGLKWPPLHSLLCIQGLLIATSECHLLDMGCTLWGLVEGVKCPSIYVEIGA